MRISTKGRYALRMLLYLAENKNDRYISLKEIANNQSLSKKYLEQIVPALTKNGLLQTNRGAHGGYKLNREPDKYTVGAVLRMTEGSLSPAACIEGEYVNYENGGGCETLFIWQGLNEAISSYLNSITLQDILNNSQEMYANNYMI